MKNNSQSSLFFLPHSLKALKPEPTINKLSEQSPYLRAVLSDKRVSGTAPVVSLADSSLAAALRYISNNK